MKLFGIVCLSVLSGIAGGIASRIIFPVASGLPANLPIHLDDGFSELDLTARALEIRWSDGRKIRIDPDTVKMDGPRNSVALGTSNEASFLYLNGEVWFAPYKQK